MSTPIPTIEKILNDCKTASTAQRIARAKKRDALDRVECDYALLTATTDAAYDAAFAALAVYESQKAKETK